MRRANAAVFPIVVMSIAFGASSSRGQPPISDRAAVGEEVVKGLRTWLDGLPAATGGRRPILAVLPPTDARGKIPLFFAETSSYLEGEIFAVLRREVGQRVVIWGPDALGGTLRAQNIDPRAVELGDEEAVRALLGRIGADAAVVGRMDLPGVDALREGTAPPFPLIFRGVSATAGAPAPIAEVVADQDLVASPWDRGKLSGRFRVEFLVNGKVVELTPHPERPEGVDNVFIAVLDPAGQVGPARSAPCSFRVGNLGGPGIGFANADDAKRLFGVVLTIDGLNAVMESAGGNQAAVFSKRAPENSRKYVLTGPGLIMVPDADAKVPGHPDEKCGYDLRESTSDGASWEVKGFQDGVETAKQFVLTTNVNKWVAPQGDAAVGWITVHVFAQWLPGDVVKNPSFANVGVAQGPTVAQRTFPVRVKWYPRPVESWRIYYTMGPDGKDAGQGGKGVDGAVEAITKAIPLAR